MTPFDPQRFITDRLKAIDASGIRRVFDLAAKLPDPVNLSIGQPDFDVPDPIKEAAISAIRRGVNRYTVTQGVAELKDKVNALIAAQLPNWKAATSSSGGGGQSGGFDTLITSGVSGGLMLALLCCVGPGDEVLIPDPYFVMYKHLVTLAGAKAVFIDTYPDFRLTAERIAPHITPQTKLLLFNSPSNPTGAVSTDADCRQIVELTQRHNILLLTDEIYDAFWYPPAGGSALPPLPSGGEGWGEGKGSIGGTRLGRGAASPRPPTPAAFTENLLLLRGFSKTWGMTGWRLGYAAGPKPIIEQMTKLQQYSFVCAPSMAQIGGVTALDVDVSDHVAHYRRKRDRVVAALSGAYELTAPGGAFYAFPKVPERLGLSASAFVERAIARSLLIIPGSVFSRRDTHFRISYACADQMLDRGLDILLQLAQG